jgi:predicted AlkP superfamily phosphohydrolase/phosphomutase
MSLFGRSRGKKGARKVFVIGLDCAAPELVFERWKDDLPHLTRLREGGWWRDLQSCIPAITASA